MKKISALRAQTGTLKFQLILMMLGSLVIAVMGTTYVAIGRMDAQISTEIERRVNTSLRVAAKLFQEGIPKFITTKIEVNAASEPERLIVSYPASMLVGKMDGIPDEDMLRIVDSITYTNGSTATIFKYVEEKKDFIRISTTVKKADGTRAIGTFLGQNGAVYPYMMRKEAYRGQATILGDLHQTGYLPLLDDGGNVIGILYIGIGKVSDLRAESSRMLTQLGIGAIAILALAALLLSLATNRLLAPLVRVADATNALASGSAEVAVPHTDRTDPIGLIARAVDGFREAVSAQRGLERRQSEEAAKLAERKAQMDHDVDNFRGSVRANLDRLRHGVEQVRGTSASLRSVTASANERVTEGREAAELGAEAISEVATATNQFASSIAEIAGRTNDAANVVRKASETGQHAETVASELSAVVEKISNAVSFISSIASQTNLLALNATIEAARAGEAGKGFAVVASEVKELSNGTSKAAGEIAELVKSIEGVTREVTDATRAIGTGLESINETTLIIAAAVTEQEQVTRGLAGNADAAAQRSDTVRSGFGEVQSAIAETVTAADSLDGISRDFSQSADALVGEIEEFLAKMAA